MDLLGRFKLRVYSGYFLTLLTLSGVTVIFMSLKTMWIHPDSMTSGGLRFLVSGPTGFNYGTYGPFAFVLIGSLNAFLFPVGFVSGLWANVSEFENAYRTNYIEFLNLSFSKISTSANIIVILISILLLKVIISFQTEREFSVFKTSLVLCCIPITFYQFSLDTIELYVFFGVTLAIYVSYVQLLRSSRVTFRDYFLICGSFLFTIGIRFNLLLFIIPVFFILAFYKYYRNKDRQELFPVMIASLITLLTYTPIVFDSNSRQRFISQIRKLSGLDFSSNSIISNFSVLYLNLGFLGICLIVIRFVEVFSKRNNLSKEIKLGLLWLGLGSIHTVIFLSNKGGFPKYIVPIVPIIMMGLGSIFEIRGLRKLTMTRFLPAPHFFKGATVLLLFALITFNFSNYQRISQFDTREVLTSIIPQDKSWMQDAVADSNVISVLTRGKNGLEFEELSVQLPTFNSSLDVCEDLIFLSSVEFPLIFHNEFFTQCNQGTAIFTKITINPYVETGLTTDDEEVMGLLSLGTKLDRNRIGFGPLYSILISNASNYRDELIANCQKFEFCSVVQG